MDLYESFNSTYLPISPTVISNFGDFNFSKKTILTLGTFDGVHIGHRKILEKVTQNSETETTESLVLTFFPHPRMVLQEHSDIKLLNTISEKIDLLEQTGIENLVIHPFDEKFSQLTAEEFVSDVMGIEPEHPLAAQLTSLVKQVKLKNYS